MLTWAYSAQISILDTKLQTSSTVQEAISLSWGRGLSLSEFFPLLGVLTRGLFIGGPAADKSRGEETSPWFRLIVPVAALFSNPWISTSFAVRTIASKVCVVDMSMSGGNIGFGANGFRIFGKSGFFWASSLLFGIRVGKVGFGLNRGSKAGEKPLRDVPK